jgi:hypothetical protein
MRRCSAFPSVPLLKIYPCNPDCFPIMRLLSPVSCLLSPVSCLLSPVFRIQSLPSERNRPIRGPAVKQDKSEEEKN